MRVRGLGLDGVHEDVHQVVNAVPVDWNSSRSESRDVLDVGGPGRAHETWVIDGM